MTAELWADMRGPGYLIGSEGKGHGDGDTAVWVVAIYYEPAANGSGGGWLAESAPCMADAMRRLGRQAALKGVGRERQLVVVDCCSCGRFDAAASPFGDAAARDASRQYPVADIVGLVVALEALFDHRVRVPGYATTAEPRG